MHAFEFLIFTVFERQEIEFLGLKTQQVKTIVLFVAGLLQVLKLFLDQFEFDESVADALQ